jgi:hypothetical protein
MCLRVRARHCGHNIGEPGKLALNLCANVKHRDPEGDESLATLNRFRDDWHMNRRIAKGVTPLIRNPWIPAPGSTFKVLPKFYRNLYTNRVIESQICKLHPPGVPDYNFYRAASINIKAPPRISRHQYETVLRQRIETMLLVDEQHNVWRYAIAHLAMIVSVCTIFVLDALYSPNLLKGSLAVLLSLIVYAISVPVNIFISQLAGGKIVAVWRTLLISSAIWAGALLRTHGASHFAGRLWWQLPLLSTLIALATAAVVMLIFQFWIICKSFAKRPGYLDVSLLAHCLFIYHRVTAHRELWGDLSFQETLNYKITRMAYRVEHYLPRRIRQNSSWSRAEAKDIAYGISEAIRARLADVLRGWKNQPP